MTGTGTKIDALAERMLAYRTAITRKPTYVTGSGTRVQRKDQSSEWQDLCRLAGNKDWTMHDLLGLHRTANSETSYDLPIPISETSFDLITAHLKDQNREVHNRIANFKSMLRALPVDARIRVLGLGEHPWLAARQSEPRLNAPAGTFALLDEDLLAWRKSVCQPCETIFDELVPLREGVAKRVARLISCAATLLHAHGHVSETVRLAQLVERTHFDAWREVWEQDSRSVELATIEAFIRIRGDLIGRDKVVAHMNAQRGGLRDNLALTVAAIRELDFMLGRQQDVELIPFALMTIANSSDLPRPGRLKVANLAPAMQAALEFALQPGDVFALTHDGDWRMIDRRAHADGNKFQQSDGLSRLFKQRSLIRQTLGSTATNRVMSTEAGAAMNAQTCDQALARTLRHFGLPEFPWQRLRDFAAVRMLVANRNDILNVAVLLGFVDPTQVVRRYDAFLSRTGKSA